MLLLKTGESDAFRQKRKDSHSKVEKDRSTKEKRQHKEGATAGDQAAHQPGPSKATAMANKKSAAKTAKSAKHKHKKQKKASKSKDFISCAFLCTLYICGFKRLQTGLEIKGCSPCTFLP